MIKQKPSFLFATFSMLVLGMFVSFALVHQVRSQASSGSLYDQAHAALFKASTTSDVDEKQALLLLAIDLFSDVLQASPEDSNAYINRGVAYDALGQYGQAIDDQSKALRIEPGLIDALQNRGISYERWGKKREALADLEDALHGLETNPGQDTRAQRKAFVAKKVKQLRSELEKENIGRRY